MGFKDYVERKELLLERTKALSGCLTEKYEYKETLQKWKSGANIATLRSKGSCEDQPS